MKSGLAARIELQSNAKPSQFQLMQVCPYVRALGDLAVIEAAGSLRHMIGPVDTRFSSHNCSIKWKCEGYGTTLGLHCDQSQIPLPWGTNALTANCNWCLSQYTQENGAFACAPGAFSPSSDGLMVTIANDYRPVAILPQEDIPNSF